MLGAKACARDPDFALVVFQDVVDSAVGIVVNGELLVFPAREAGCRANPQAAVAPPEKGDDIVGRKLAAIRRVPTG